MGWPKGKPRKPKPEPDDDLRYEVAILKAALKQLIRENREWRIANEKAIRVLSDRANSSLAFEPGNGGPLHGMRPASGSNILQADGASLASNKRPGAA